MKVQEATAPYAALKEPLDWPQVRVGDICMAVNGRAFKPTEWTDKGVPIIRIQNLKNADAPFNHFAGALEDKFKVKAGDLLFAWSGTPGTSFGAHIWHGPDAALNQHIFNLQFDRTRVDARYFCYALNRNVAEYVTKAQGGVGLAHITKGEFEGSEIPLPPLDQQKRIVAEIEKQFSRLDEAVANLKRVKANLKRYKAAVLKAAVEGRLVETEAELARREGRSYETGAQLLQRILETRRSQWKGKGKYKEPAAPDTTDLPELPEGWVWACLSQLLIEPIVNGLSIKESAMPTEVRALRLSAMSDEGFDYSDHRFLPTNVEQVADILIREGDFFVSRGNGSLHLVGRATVAQSPEFNVIFPDTMMRLRLAQPAELTSWLRTIWQGTMVRRQIEKSVKTTAGIYKISQPELAHITMPLPPRIEQHRIVAEVDRRLSILHETEGQVVANLRRAERLRQSVLRRAFSGDLCPQDETLEATA